MTTVNLTNVEVDDIKFINFMFLHVMQFVVIFEKWVSFIFLISLI